MRRNNTLRIALATALVLSMTLIGRDSVARTFVAGAYEGQFQTVNGPIAGSTEIELFDPVLMHIGYDADVSENSPGDPTISSFSDPSLFVNVYFPLTGDFIDIVPVPFPAPFITQQAPIGEPGAIVQEIVSFNGSPSSASMVSGYLPTSVVLQPSETGFAPAGPDLVADADVLPVTPPPASGGVSFNLVLAGGQGGVVSISGGALTAVPIPEPSTGLGLAAGAIMLGGLARFRFHAPKTPRSAGPTRST